mgnify:CR=1 FL=1
MGKGISIGIGVGIGLIALAVILLVPGEVNESPIDVQLSDEVEIMVEESKEYTVDISEGLEIGDNPP